MRIGIETIELFGERVSPHSKFYIYEDVLYEPVIYRGKLARTYKPITDTDRIRKIMNRKLKVIPSVSSVCNFKPKKKYNNSSSRFDLLDIRED